MAYSRLKERETVFRLLFIAEHQPELGADELLALSEESEETALRTPYVTETLRGAMDFAPRATKLAASASRDWRVERMSPVLRALLKLSLYEMLENDAIPVKVAANEAVELCKRYEDEKAARFLNGILGTLSAGGQNGKQ